METMHLEKENIYNIYILPGACWTWKNHFYEL